MLAWFLANFSAMVFYCLAAVAVAGAVGVIAFRSPVHAALSLLGSFLAVAGVFVLLHAEFLAAVQILVYAGGVMVLFLFVIMLVNVRTLAGEGQYVRRLVPAAVVLGIVLAALIGVGVVAGGQAAAADPAALTAVAGVPLGNTEAVGWSLYRDDLLPFEVVSVVLLVAMIGAIVLGRKELGAKEGA
jgi:NADH-quinone oxidoreductase subunit J